MDKEKFSLILTAMKSPIRRQILNLLIEEHDGLRFSEIAKNLNIHSSTLEKHLAKLVENNIIAHYNSLYLSTLTSIQIWNGLEFINKIPLNSYLSTHVLLLKDRTLRKEFDPFNFEVIPDIFSVLNRIRENFEDKLVHIQAGGQLDYKIGRGIYGSNLLNHKEAKVEMILTTQIIKEIQQHGEENMFLNHFNKKIRIYAIDECNIGLGVSDFAGFLFLPSLDFSVDFQQCLFTQNPKSLNWLKKVFNYLKSKSQIFLI